MTSATGSGEPIVIQPIGRFTDLGLRELWRSRSIVMVLTRRTLKVRYRQTLLGIAWVLLQPLILMTVYTVFFSLIARSDLYGLPYPVFFLCGLAFWLPAIKILNEGTNSILMNAQLVTRIYLPRASLPLSVALATLVDLTFTLVALGVILWGFGYPPSARWLVVLFLIPVAYATAIGITFWLAALNTMYRDVQLMLPFLTQLWFFLSPIIYPAHAIPAQFLPIYFLNPLALVFTASRWALAGGPPPPDFAWVIAPLVSVTMLVTGYLFFHRREPTFADVL